MSLTHFSIDDGSHNTAGLRFYAQDGAEQVEALIGRKLSDVWAESVEHRQSLFRDQYNANVIVNLAAIERIVNANSSEAPRSTGNILLSRFIGHYGKRRGFRFK